MPICRSKLFCSYCFPFARVAYDVATPSGTESSIAAKENPAVRARLSAVLAAGTMRVQKYVLG